MSAETAGVRGSAPARPGPGAVEVEVSLPRLLRESVPGCDSLWVAGATLREALDALKREHPLLRVHLFDETGRTRPHVLIYYNGDNIAWLESWDVALRPGDQLHVLQAVSGG